MSKVKQVLTIAGSDSGGGAGIQADLKTFQERYVFGMSVITAVTAQNTLGVQDSYPIPLEMVQAQLDSVFSDFEISAVKTGMLVNADYMELIAEELKKHPDIPYVCDPVMIAKGGHALMEDEAVPMLKETLLPLATVFTPNIPEAETLIREKITTRKDMVHAARILQDYGAKNVLLKGGHELGASDESSDYLLLENSEEMWVSGPRYQTENTHGTGDTLAAAITSELTKGKNVKEAVEVAKAFMDAAIREDLEIGNGHGPTNHWAYRKYEKTRKD